MASKRMFSLDIVDTDKFLEMSTSAQALYFHLGMRADDDGFVSSPKKIATIAGCNIDDLKLLVTKGYIIPFDSGAVVISDWNVNNWVRPDRKHNTLFQYEREMLKLENGAYLLVDNLQPSDNRLTDKRHTEISIDKNSIDKNNKQCASDNAPKVSKAAINEFFESIWKLYPSKKGKGQISDSKKKVLYDIGYEEMSRTIERYKAGLAKDEWRKPQNGSTFFNSGYIDYLDANYSEPEQITDPEEGDRSIYQDEEDYRRLREELG